MAQKQTEEHKNVQESKEEQDKEIEALRSGRKRPGRKRPLKSLGKSKTETKIRKGQGHQQVQLPGASNPRLWPVDPQVITDIENIFEKYIVPGNVLTVFQRYHSHVLVDRDKEQIRKDVDNKGNKEGAVALLERLRKYLDWFDCLLCTLRDEDVKQKHVAEMIEQAAGVFKFETEEYQDKITLANVLDLHANIRNRDTQIEDKEREKKKLTEEYEKKILEIKDEHDKEVQELKSDKEKLLKDLHEAKTETKRQKGFHGEAKDERSLGRSDGATLKDRFKKCRKSARHSEYIPVPDFCIDLLPLQYRTERMLAFVKAQVKLTVLINVDSTSDRRPEHFPGAGKGERRRGSGRIVAVRIKWYKAKECSCEECQTSGTPRQSRAEIEVETVAHMVFNLAEGRDTVCYLNYDDESTPLTSCPTLRTAVSVESDPGCDFSLVTFVTHDLEWAQRLKETIRIYERLWDEIHREYGVKYTYDASEEGLLDNISVLYRKCQQMMEKCHEWIHRLRDMTIAEAVSRLEEYKSKHNIQPGDELSGYGKWLEKRICGGDLLEERLSDMTGRYEEIGGCVTGFCDLEENYQSYVQQHGIQWVKDKYRDYYDKLKVTAEWLGDFADNDVFDMIDLFYYNPSHPLTVIVSHPHGLRKQISIGQVIRRNRGMIKGYEFASYSYTATTCPGSAGAPVYILGRGGKLGYHKTCPHSGGCDTIDVNKSGIVFDL